MDPVISKTIVFSVRCQKQRKMVHLLIPDIQAPIVSPAKESRVGALFEFFLLRQSQRVLPASCTQHAQWCQKNCYGICQREARGNKKFVRSICSLCFTQFTPQAHEPKKKRGWHQMFCARSVQHRTDNEETPWTNWDWHLRNTQRTWHLTLSFTLALELGQKSAKLCWARADVLVILCANRSNGDRHPMKMCWLSLGH